MASDVELVRHGLAGVGQAAAHRTLHHALDDALDDALHFHHALDDGGDHRVVEALGVLFLADVLGGVALGAERLAELASVAVEGVGLEAELPAEAVAGADVLDLGLVGEVDGLADGTRDEGLRGGHHADVAFGRDEARAEVAAAVGAVEHREVLVLEVRRTFHRLRAADAEVECVDLLAAEAEGAQAVELLVGAGLGGIDAQCRHHALRHAPRAEREGDLEDRGEAVLDLHHLVAGVAGLDEEVAERGAVGRDGAVLGGHGHLEAERAHHVRHDLVHLHGRVAEGVEGGAQALVGDLEVTAARELLELGEREVRLDAGGVAVHQQADGAGRCDHRDLGVAEAVLLAEGERVIPCGDRTVEHVDGVRDVDAAGLEDAVVDGHRRDAQVLVLAAGAGDALGGATVVADHAEHVLLVLLVAVERTVLRGKHRARGVAAAGEDGAERAADRAAGVAVVRDARLHQHGAEVGVAEAEGAVLPAELGDFLRREARHQDADLEDHGPQADRVLVALDVEGACLRVVELEQVDRRQVARRVVEEHVLAARVAGVDATALGAGVPGVDGGVVLDARVRAVPRGLVDLAPELGGGQGLRDLAVDAADQLPLAFLLDRVHERVGEADGVVGILAADGVVGLAVEVVVELQAELLGDLALVRRELLHALDERRDLDLLADLPVDELLDVRVVHVQADHLGGAARGAARLDGARGAVADLEEAHQARAAAAAREGLVLAAQVGEVGAGARAVLEETGLAGPEVHDAAFADQVILHALDEAGVGLRVGVGVLGQADLAGLVVCDPVALRRAADAVRVVEAGVEPLRAVRRRHLVQEHVRQLVVERVRVLLAGEVAELLAPVLPAAGEAVHHLLDAALRPEDRLAGGILHRAAIGAQLRNARLAEVLADHDVRGELAPRCRNLRILHLEDGAAVGVADAARAGGPLEGSVDVLACGGEASCDAHVGVLFLCLSGSYARCLRVEVSGNRVWKRAIDGATPMRCAILESVRVGSGCRRRTERRRRAGGSGPPGPGTCRPCPRNSRSRRGRP